MTQVNPMYIAELLNGSSRLLMQKEAECAALRAENEALKQRTVSYDTLVADQQKRARCEKIASSMVEAGHIDISEERNYVESLMQKEAQNLDSVEEALNILSQKANTGDFLLGSIDKVAQDQGGTPGTPGVTPVAGESANQFWTAFGG